ncbi:MAG: hypothetical protein R2860_02245 [Desulfobacterales bacterium]
MGAKQSGMIDPAIDEHVTSLCLDNLILMLQYSITDYLKRKGERYLLEKTRLMMKKRTQGTMRLIRKALPSQINRWISKRNLFAYKLLLTKPKQTY